MDGPDCPIHKTPMHCGSTTNEWEYVCKACDKRYNRSLETMPDDWCGRDGCRCTRESRERASAMSVCPNCQHPRRQHPSKLDDPLKKCIECDVEGYSCCVALTLCYDCLERRADEARADYESSR